MSLEQKYEKYKEKRNYNTNKQIWLFSRYLDNIGVEDMESYIRRNWDHEIWDVLETILTGKNISYENKRKLDSWDIEDRCLEEFLVKVFYSWFLEDTICDWLNCQSWITNQYSVHKGGTDSERKLVNAKYATGEPDIYVKNKKNEKKVLLEVTTDNSGFTINEGANDLRNRKNGMSKYEELQSKRNNAEVDKVFLVIVDTKNINIVFVPIDDDTEVLKIFINEKYNGRECTRIKVDKSLHRFRVILKK